MITISPHAQRRMNEMLVDETEVIDAVTAPELDAPDKDNEGRRVAVKGRLRVVHVPQGDDQVVCTVLWQGKASRAEGPTTSVPNNISNRAFYEKLILWGCNTGRKRGDMIYIRTPKGDQLRIRPPGYSAGNSKIAISGAYKSLGVSAEEFWARTEPVKPARERLHATPGALKSVPSVKEATVAAPARPKVPSAPKLDTQVGRVYAYLRGYPGVETTTATIAQGTGLTHAATANSTQWLVAQGHIERTRVGHFRYRRWGESEAARKQAAENLAWVTDPANFAQPQAAIRRAVSPPTQPGKPRMGRRMKEMLAIYQKRPGEIIRPIEISERLGISIRRASQSAAALVNSGYLAKGDKRGHYFYPAPADTPEPEQPDEPTTVDVGPVDVSPAVEAPPTPVREASVVAAPASLDDEIDTFLELLVPGGLRARHFDIGHRWYLVTRELLEATREKQ
jgi:hypothetical protein